MPYYCVLMFKMIYFSSPDIVTMLSSKHSHAGKFQCTPNKT